MVSVGNGFGNCGNGMLAVTSFAYSVCIKEANVDGMPLAVTLGVVVSYVPT